MVQVQQRTDLDLRVGEVQLQIHEEMEHKYLTSFLRPPSLEFLQVVLADAMLRAAGLSKQVAETVLSSLLLIYHGLAVHDDIEELSAKPDERYRQLGVLAGDYYSSKYYRLLSVVGEIGLIGRFARAIQTINEAKAELERDPSDFALRADRYLQLQETIQGTLLHALRVHYVPDLPVFETIVSQLVRAEVYSRELSDLSSHVWSRTLTNLSVWQNATGEERKWLKHLSVGQRSESRLLSLHVKYGTSSDVYQQVEECVRLACDALGRTQEPLDEVRDLCARLMEVRPMPWRAAEEGY